MSDPKPVTTPELPKGWHVSWMGQSDGMFIAQLRCDDYDDEEIGINDRGIISVSRTGLTWLEALTEAILVIEKRKRL